MIATHDQLTVAEAADYLRVSQSTIRRWIRQGQLPAFRVGPRNVRIPRRGIEGLARPVHGDTRAGSSQSIEEIREKYGLRPLTPEERQRGLEMVANLKKRLEEHIAAGGELLSPSWEIIDELRRERTEQLG